ncbi:uncharacterized protein LOC130737113 [Lotus japonicus]|uniref:uncharacterized protein LOC130737113 n=1 Tax=Lotus japonicus TaxID=34305 RepID=UPI00258F606A|nr:uncharacterized protein LOC130737113 [Lotus japonicus]
MKWNCVSDCGNWEQEVWRWKFLWRRPLVGRELEWEQALQGAVGVVQLSEGVPDAWTWLPSNDRIYSVHSSYLFLQEPVLPDQDHALMHVWQSYAPSNVKGFAWRVLLDRIVSKENMLKRGIFSSVGSASCALCNNHLETCFHLLFSCPFSIGVWNGCLQWLGCSLSQVTSVHEHLSGFRVGLTHSQQRLCHSIWLAVIWSVWLARNEVVFGEVLPALR